MNQLLEIISRLDEEQQEQIHHKGLPLQINKTLKINYLYESISNHPRRRWFFRQN